MAKKSNVKIPTIAIIRSIVFLFIGVILFWLYSITAGFLNKDPMFNVKNVMVDQSISFIDYRLIKELKGQNIFSVDLGKIHKQIASRYPQISQLRVVRQLPDTIEILAKKREALLQVQAHNKFLIVDTEGVTMFYTVSPIPLPLVKGIPLERSRVVMGAVSNIKELNSMVELLKQLKLHPNTSKLRIASIDAANLSKIELFVLPAIQIIIDQEDLNSKVDMLEILLQNGKINWSQVKYVDIRFKEPIINETVPVQVK